MRGTGDGLSLCEVSEMIPLPWKMEEEKRAGEYEHRGGRVRPDTLASCKGKVEKESERRIQGNLIPGHVPLNSCL